MKTLIESFKLSSRWNEQKKWLEERIQSLWPSFIQSQSFSQVVLFYIIKISLLIQHFLLYFFKKNIKVASKCHDKNEIGYFYIKENRDNQTDCNDFSSIVFFYIFWFFVVCLFDDQNAIKIQQLLLESNKKKGKYKS